MTVVSGYEGDHISVITGLNASYTHSQNGMTLNDMQAALRVANQLDEVILFRSTGPWAKRWIERGYPTKNFHVKGKSSDWGPQAGFVPYDGTYSKVGYDATKAADGTHANDKGLQSQFARSGQLRLSLAELQMQRDDPEGEPPRRALESMVQLASSEDYLLTAKRSGDGKLVAFRAVKLAGKDAYDIYVYPEKAGLDPRRLAFETPLPLMVMHSGEAGADKPMTGDYDLFAICPTWGQYGSQAPADFIKPGIRLAGPKGVQPGVATYAGQGMDNVFDPTLHTMTSHPTERKGVTNSLASHPADPARTEHADMGNLTPRILRCINALNAAMGAVKDKSPLRRVHHNAESHRNARFGALTHRDMHKFKDGESFGDGFPFTVFQPARAQRAEATRRYGEVCTLEHYAEFATYAADLHRAGYYVPRNWVWQTQKMMDVVR